MFFPLLSSGWIDSPMTFSYLGGAITKGTGETASLAVTAPFTAAVGQLVLVAHAGFTFTSGTSVNVSDNLGNTWRLLGHTSWITAGRNLTLFSSNITNPGTLTATVTPSSGEMESSIIIDGFAVPSGFSISLDGSVLTNFSNVGTNPTMTAGTLTPSGIDLFYAVGGQDGDNTVWTGNGTLTESAPGQSGANDAIAGEYFLDQTSPLVPNFTPTPNNQDWGMVAAAFVATPTNLQASASLSANSTLSAVSTVTIHATANMPCNSILSAANTVTIHASANLSATSTLTAVATGTVNASANLSATSTLSAVSTVTINATANLPCNSILSAVAGITTNVSVSLEATSTLSAVATLVSEVNTIEAAICSLVANLGITIFPSYRPQTSGLPCPTYQVDPVTYGNTLSSGIGYIDVNLLIDVYGELEDDATNLANTIREGINLLTNATVGEILIQGLFLEERTTGYVRLAENSDQVTFCSSDQYFLKYLPPS
jgi:hypothetical protein